MFAAKGIAGGSLWETGWAAVKVGATAASSPMCVYSTALMMLGPWQDIVLAAISAAIGVICLAAGLHSYFIEPTKWWERILLLSAAMVLITPGLITDLIGAGVLAVTVASNCSFPVPKRQTS